MARSKGVRKPGLGDAHSRNGKGFRWGFTEGLRGYNEIWLAFRFV